ncbi:MAG: hypothetical protein U5K69_18360 [Balneolaceae bacterium]|nr:hypothetical protein [Balneolaceae bacterium]
MTSKEPLSNVTALAFESRMADSTSKLLRRQGANTISAPSMQEVPLKNHTAVFSFSEQLFAGEVDILLCMTGVGTDMLIKTMKTKYEWRNIHQALSDIIVLSGGPSLPRCFGNLRCRST